MLREFFRAQAALYPKVDFQNLCNKSNASKRAQEVQFRAEATRVQWFMLSHVQRFLKKKKSEQKPDSLKHKLGNFTSEYTDNTKPTSSSRGMVWTESPHFPASLVKFIRGLTGATNEAAASASGSAGAAGPPPKKAKK